MTVYNSDIRPDTPRNRGDYDAPHMTSVTPEEDIRSIMINRVSWGAVFAGMALALVTQMILNLAGLGIGVATLTPDTTSDMAVANLSLGTAIWWTLSGILAAYIGGYAAGRLSGEPRESTAGWHGLTSWATSVLLLAALVVAGAGASMGGMLNNLGLTSAGNGTVSMRYQPGNAAAGTSSAATAEMSAQNLARPEGIPLDEARLRVQQQTPPAAATPGTSTARTGTTTTAANANADTLSRLATQGALLSALALLFGALAAWFGGSAAVVKPTITTPDMRVH